MVTFYPEKYNRNSRMQNELNMKYLEEYEHNASWKSNCYSVIDLGSGDGDFTSNVVVKMLPDTCKEIVGCDKSEEMVRFANEHYKDDRVKFEVFDLEDTLPARYYNRFNQAFSFTAIHWVHNQEQAYSNIFDLLTPGGGCFIVFPASSKFFSNFRDLVKLPRWKPWAGVLKDVISLFQDCPDPEAKLTGIMTKVGFTDIEVACKKTSHTYESVEDFKGWAATFNVLGVPENDFEDYINDYVRLAVENRVIDENHRMNFTAVIARGKKPMRTDIIK